MTGTKISEVCGVIIPFAARRIGYHYLTAIYPYKSIIGNQYIFVSYDYDGNTILAKSIKYKQIDTICYAWQCLNNILKSKGNDPNLYIIDNESSYYTKEAMMKYETNYQLSPPHMHRCNASEIAIRSFKNHFLQDSQPLILIPP